MLKKLWDLLAVQQDSLPGLFNWKDGVHVVRMTVFAAVALAGVTFLKGVDAHNWGLLDKIIADLAFAGITAIEAWKTNNS